MSGRGYAHWHAVLKGGRPPISPDDIQLGFYRTREQKGGPLLPVAVWEDGADLRCSIGGKLKTEDQARERWPWFAYEAITHEVYQAVAERGEPWPDIDETVSEQIAGAGHNQAPDEDSPEVLREQIEGLAKGADAYAKIGDDEQAAKAQTLRARLNELSGKADKIREKEKRPHIEAGRAVDELWQPIVKAGKAAADKVKAALSAFETAKLRAEQEARRKAEEERRRHEEEARKAAEAGKPAPVPPPAPAPAPAPETSRIKGAAGRAASVRVVKVATVTDQDAVYGYCKTHPEVVELLAKLAQRAVDAGHDIPGVSVEEERRVA